MTLRYRTALIFSQETYLHVHVHVPCTCSFNDLLYITMDTTEECWNGPLDQLHVHFSCLFFGLR